MKKILYLTNIEVPYRTVFFNELCKFVDLTVLYERRVSRNRDSSWNGQIEKKYKAFYLDGINIGNEYSFSFKLLEVLFKEWDCVIVGCYNSLSQILAMIVMKLKGIPFIINLDGEPFLSQNWKTRFKIFILNMAYAYLVAGEKSAKSLQDVVKKQKIIKPYYFSSLTEEEVKIKSSFSGKRKKKILVVGQYFDYKGMDVALRVATMDKSLNYKFVGMGKRTDLFKKEMGYIPENVEITPFLDKTSLEKEYRECSLLVLPTRQECWGLVVNEAAAFGTPIVSTWGSGAAVEFLSDLYPQYLATPGNAESLLKCIRDCLGTNVNEYSEFLKKKALLYFVEKTVKVHSELINDLI